jgi:hypothetical protein
MNEKNAPFTELLNINPHQPLSTLINLYQPHQPLSTSSTFINLINLYQPHQPLSTLINLYQPHQPSSTKNIYEKTSNTYPDRPGLFVFRMRRQRKSSFESRFGGLATCFRR